MHYHTRNKIKRLLGQSFGVATVATECGVTITEVEAVRRGEEPPKGDPPKRKSSYTPICALDDLGHEAARAMANLRRYQLWDLQEGRDVRSAEEHRRIVQANYGRGY